MNDVIDAAAPPVVAGAAVRDTVGRLAETPAGDAILNAIGLWKSYGADVTVLRDVELTVREGESVALIGANGSGKSTLLKCLVGLLAIDRGEIDLFGCRVRRDGRGAALRAIRRQTGFVFQNHGLVRRLCALSNVVHGRLGDGGSWLAVHHAIAPAAIRREAFAALDAVGLADKAMARADELSGGQAQRVAIARALVRKPRLLIADEPAASLDPAAGHEVMHTFARIAASGTSTLLFTTHDMEHALHFATRIVGLRQGVVALDAPAATLRRSDLEHLFA
ncbi:MAG TPA: ATP-binding cassette domain-containing protein [Rhizobiaceae bacterium]|nr:ATP-binding cassette domain-containing protein [Rhizobiaceae bacterium]